MGTEQKSNGLEESLMNAGELTPITINEAKKILGKSSDYSSGEALAVAILDFTAITRAYLRSLPKMNDSKNNANEVY